jgi:2-polyprenyl-3-methyl-5-hydroxy-6-metoxy-1,4-benzoquinol methylase
MIDDDIMELRFNNSRANSFELDRAVFPEFKLFANACRQGLSVVYPLKAEAGPDPFGWKFGAGWPPSYSAFGRMRSLLAVQDALRLKPGRVLEVASGGGGLSACLAKAGCGVVVNDLLEDGTREAIKEYSTGDALQFIGGNLFNLLPEQTGQFDLVIACEIIEHVAHPLDLLKHLREFLLPGGRILLTTPNGSHFRNKLPTYTQVADLSELESRQFMPDADGHLFLFSPQELTELASTAGLRIEQLKCWGTQVSCCASDGARCLQGGAVCAALERWHPRAYVYGPFGDSSAVLKAAKVFLVPPASNANRDYHLEQSQGWRRRDLS